MWPHCWRPLNWERADNAEKRAALPLNSYYTIHMWEAFYLRISILYYVVKICCFFFQRDSFITLITLWSCYNLYLFQIYNIQYMQCALPTALVFGPFLIRSYKHQLALPLLSLLLFQHICINFTVRCKLLLLLFLSTSSSGNQFFVMPQWEVIPLPN